MTFYNRPNHVTKAVRPVTDPLAIARGLPSYDRWKGNKARFRKWQKNPETEHYHLSLCRGAAVNEIINQDNPLSTVGGLIFEWEKEPEDNDIDAPEGLEPTYITRTFSGGVRLFYVFDEPVSMLPGLFKEFVRAAMPSLKVAKFFGPGLDKNAALNPGMYYEIGRDWQETGNTIETATVLGWISKAGKRHDWSGEGLKVPIEEVRKELADRYPGLWPGGWESFDIGSRGGRFWDDEPDGTSAVVYPTGIYCWSQHFRKWSDPDLLGGKALRYAEKVIGEAVEDVYFDGSRYWTESPKGWVPSTKEDMRDVLLERGLSGAVGKGEQVSEVVKALNLARNQNRIIGAVPKLYAKPGPFRDTLGEDYLNISRVKPVSPRPDRSEGWGDGFPWLSRYLDEVFLGDDKERFLAWLRHLYLGAVNRDFQRGLALIIAGQVGIGKTFLNGGVIGQLMGGSQDATSFMIDKDKFNDQLLKQPIWQLDDVVVENRTRFTTILKRVTANDKMTYRAMRASPVAWEWLGRVVITCNDDAEGLTVLPRTDRNILDKCLILRGHRPTAHGGRYPSDRELVEGGELAALGAFLRDHPSKPEFVTDGRFGVVDYADPELLETAQEATPVNSVIELLEAFRKERAEANDEKGPWKGSATDLLAALHESTLAPIARGEFRNAAAVGSRLRHLSVDWLRSGRDMNKRFWIIDPIEHDT